MSPQTNTTAGYKHLMRVRLGQHGPAGRLLHCEKKDKSGWYWKVKLDSGEWVWPADLHVDGTGPLVSHCRDCGLPFIHERAGEPSAATATRTRTAPRSAHRNPRTTRARGHAGQHD
jgi:hypothetical protein